MKDDITKHVFRFGHPYNEGSLFRLASDAPIDQKELAHLGVAMVTLQKENNELWKEVQYLEETNEALHERLDEAEVEERYDPIHWDELINCNSFRQGNNFDWFREQGIKEGDYEQKVNDYLKIAIS